jgi:hypothetical protein
MAHGDGERRTASRPRCDGVYASAMTGANGAHGWNYLRFHPDGRVTAAWARTEPDEIAAQLTPDRDDLDQGYLSFDDEIFGFSTVSRGSQGSRSSQGDWAGAVQPDGTLFVRSVSQVDGETTDETYTFYQV